MPVTIFQVCYVVIGGKCEVHIDGYYIIVIMCALVGFVWFLVFQSQLKKYELVKTSDWMIDFKQQKLVKNREP